MSARHVSETLTSFAWPIVFVNFTSSFHNHISFNHCHTMYANHVFITNQLIIIFCSCYLKSLELIKSTIKQQSLGDGGNSTAVCNEEQVNSYLPLRNLKMMVFF